MENTDFSNVLEYCSKEKFFLGEGSPTSRILIIGKECGWNNKKMPNPDKKENIILQEKCSTEHNLDCWLNGNGRLDQLKTDALKDWPNSPTWRNYQTLVQTIIGKEIPKYDFLDYSFITELSQICLPNSNYLKNNDLTKESIEKRKSLFKKDFFRKFPIVIMACGHYPKKFNFDIEDIFDVKWTGETTILSKGNYYNVHYGKSKILIHTRQVSIGVTNQLLFEIAELCKKYYK